MIITIDNLERENPMTLLKLSDFLRNIASMKIESNLDSISSTDKKESEINGPFDEPKLNPVHTFTEEELKTLSTTNSFNERVKELGAVTKSMIDDMPIEEQTEKPAEVFKKQVLNTIANSMLNTIANSIPNIPQPKVEIDIDGFPWDSRIHARTKTKNVNGSWKLLRNVDSNLVNTVKAELKKTMALPVPPPILNNVPVPPPPQGVSIETFLTLMPKITAAVNSGKINRAKISEILTSVGLNSLALLNTRPDLISSVSAAIDAELLG